MVIIEIKRIRKHYVDILRNKVKLPRFRRKDFTGLIVRDSALEVIRARFKNLPDLRDAAEVYYPGELGLFVYSNLLSYLKLDAESQKPKSKL